MPKEPRCRAPLLRPFTPMESIVTALLIRGDSRTTIQKKLDITAWGVNNHLANAARKKILPPTIPNKTPPASSPRMLANAPALPASP